MNEIKAGELKLAYQIQGKGPPLVLLHGGVTDSRSWRKQIEELSDNFQVIAWDAPGCGKSSDPPENINLGDYADYLYTFLQEIGAENPHLAGLSFGAGLAIEFYRKYPHIPKTLILASAYAGWAGSLSPDIVEERLKKGIEQSEMPAGQVVDSWIPGLFSDLASDAIKEETATIMSDFHPSGMRTMLIAFANADLREVLPNIRIPTLLLYGEKDQRSPLKVAESLHKSIPTSRLVVIPKAGHACHAEAPEAFNAEVRKFIYEKEL
jgi:pimeloyl-ACP methyl ester carboxylesterase